MLLQQFPEILTRPQPNLFEDWMVAVFLLVLGLLAYVRTVYQRRLNRLVNATFRIQILRQMMREELVFSHPSSVLMFLNFSLISGLLLYQTANFFGLSIGVAHGFRTYLLWVCGVLVFYALKALLINFLRWIFRDGGVLREYLFEIFLLNKIANLVLLPTVILLTFLNISMAGYVLAGIGIFLGVLLLFRIFTGLKTAATYHVSGVYIILYLCALEIAPLVLVVDLLMRRV